MTDKKHEEELDDEEFEEDDDLEDDEDFEDDDEVEGNTHNEEPDEVSDDINRIMGARARAVVEHVVNNLVEYPEEVDIEVDERKNEVIISVHASPNDMGRLIGRRGRVIQAIRTVARAAAATEGARATVDVVE